ncbi:hypothetical protein [Oribacterium sp. WCC10]|uniref:hypothetical protein n=1 Tax=Oribacterium sp. WCC10 TaxID=1855343 RepID=UPI0008E53D9B|nr:hypothetical protein [Oribacterium sp. WCC10]SFG60797.1 hypothetical protein SAMN05216356_114120 [Oribacterium sp. WCC10]
MIMKPVKGKNFNEFFSQIKGCGTTHPSVVERYVPVEDFQTETAQHEVFGVPTTILYFEGKEILRKSGYYSLEEFFAKAERILEITESQE